MKRLNHAYLNPLLRVTAASLVIDALLLLLLSVVPSLATEAVFGNVFSVFWLMGLGVCLGVSVLITALTKLWRRRHRSTRFYPGSTPLGSARLMQELLVWTVVALVFCFNTLLYCGTSYLGLSATVNSISIIVVSILLFPPLIIAAQLGAIATVLIKAQPGPFRWPRRTLLVSLVVVCLSVVLMGQRIPAQLAFQFAQPTLEQALENPDSPLQNQRIGPYRVLQQTTQANGSNIFTLDSPPGLFSLLNHTGFVHAPNTSTHPFGEDEYYNDYSYTHLTGDWYTFEVHRNEYF
ncbi:MAG: hypothetical protein AAFU71_13660 [Cyanobacteria bacterium J06632_22]